MDGLSRPAGAPVPISFDGQTLLFGGICIEHFGIIEQHLLKKRPNIISLAIEAARQITDQANEEIAALPSADPSNPAAVEARRKKAQAIAEEARGQAESIKNQAFAETRKISKISREEFSDWIDSFEGVAFSLWLDWSERYPGKYTLEQITKILNKMGNEHLATMIAARDQASGTDDLGNSTGPTPEKPTTTGSQDGTSPSIGELSTTN
jgi:hypothetical protein